MAAPLLCLLLSLGLMAARAAALKVAVTAEPDTLSPFASPAKQTPYFVYDLLHNRNGYDAFLLNLGPGNLKGAMELPDAILKASDKIISFDAALATGVDVVIDVVRLKQAQVDQLQAAGVKVISYRPYSEFDIMGENIIYNRSLAVDLFHAKGYDAVFLTPATNRTAAFYELILASPVATVPLMWSPRLPEKVGSQLQRPTYAPRDDKRAVAIFEVNDHLNRQMLLPMTIVELAYRQNPDAFTNAYVTNTEELRTNKHFKKLATKHMRVYAEAKKMSFETRYRSLWFMSVFGDVAVSHQLDSTGSYLALELLHGNWPLVHNNPELKDCGYYYEDCDGDEGAAQLLKALLEHDLEGNASSYNIKAQACVDRHLFSNSRVAAAWDRAIQKVARPSSRASAAASAPPAAADLSSEKDL